MGVKVLPVQCDVMDVEQIKSAFKEGFVISEHKRYIEVING